MDARVGRCPTAHLESCLADVESRFVERIDRDADFGNGAFVGVDF